MHLNILQDLGFSLNESKIYEALLEIGECSISEIANRTGIHRRSIYDTLNRLTQKGVVSPIIGTKESKFAPVDPAKFLEIIEEKRIKLQEALPDMQNLYEQKKIDEGAYTYKGIEGFKNVLRDVIKIRQNVYVFAGRDIWNSNSLKPFIESFWKEAYKKKIKFYIILEAGKENALVFNKSKIVAYRFLPRKYSSTTAIDMFYGNRTVSVIGEAHTEPTKNLTTIMVINKKLAERYKQWFQFMWDNCSSKP
jgi:sugar-specific transcriptional regulator TrmB